MPGFHELPSGLGRRVMGAAAVLTALVVAGTAAAQPPRSPPRRSVAPASLELTASQTDGELRGPPLLLGLGLALSLPAAALGIASQLPLGLGPDLTHAPPDDALVIVSMTLAISAGALLVGGIAWLVERATR